MAATRPSAAYASVVYLKIPEFSRHPVVEQARLRERLESAVAAALPCLDEGERIVLEAPDAAALIVLGNPAGALDFARRAVGSGDGAGLATGIGHGPVRVADDPAAPIVFGDAFVVAAAMADFAPADGIAVTREFRDALIRCAPARARPLVAAGTRQGAGDRSHELYVFDEAAARHRRRRFLLGAGAACAAIVAAGAGIRAVRGRLGRAGLATLRFEISPQGEIYVDGVAKGRTPPLASIQVEAGKHTVEIRNARFSPLVVQLEAGPGEEIAIKHTFAAPPSRSLWRRFIDQFK